MKPFSQHIRDGAKFSKQIKGQMKSPHGGGTCALGAGFEDAGFDVFQEQIMNMVNAFPILSEFGSCPKCTVLENVYIQQLIPHLNDFHSLSREAIAEWLEVEEKAFNKRNAKKKLNIDVKAKYATLKCEASWLLKV